jgi:hypothetical protein
MQRTVSCKSKVFTGKHLCAFKEKIQPLSLAKAPPKIEKREEEKKRLMKSGGVSAMQSGLRLALLTQPLYK